MEDFKFMHYVIAMAIVLVIEVFVVLSLMGCITVTHHNNFYDNEVTIEAELTKE